MLRSLADIALKLPLLLLVLLPGACHLTNQAEEGTLGIAGDSSWTAHDRLVVLLEDGRGTDTLFDGKLAGMDTLSRLPAGGYGGGQAVFVIQGFRNGELEFEEHRSYDGSGQRVLLIDIPFDRRRGTGSPDLDLRPEQVRLYLGGEAATLEVFPAGLPETRPLAWKTGNPAVATVSPEGVIQPVGVGATYVQAASGDSLRDASAVRVVRDVPMVDAGSADTTVPAGTAISFHVKVDQEYGDVAVFAWDLNGDGVFEDSAAGTAGQTRFATPSRTFGTGEIQVGFRVRDGEGNPGAASKRVRVSASAPKIDSLGAGPPVVSIKDTVSFSALVSGNGAGLQSFAWDFDGDGTDDRTGSLQGEKALVSGVHAYPQPATYRARLRITDENGIAQAAEVPVTVKLDPPIADAGTDRTALPEAQVRLRGTASDSGRIVAREWKCGPAEFTAAGDSGAHVFTAPSAAGTTFCIFRVTDDDGLSAEDTLKVVVDEADAPSIPSFAPADTTLTIRDSVMFTASVTAGTADLKAYSLDLNGDGVAEMQGTLSGRSGEIRAGRRFPSAGTFDITLKVEDQSGKTATSPARVLVLLDPPKAWAGDDTTVVAGTRVHLHGTARDSLGTVVLREWRVGTGPYTRVAAGDTTFTAPMTVGPLVCTFKVTDDDGQVAEDTVEVTVSPARVADLSALTASAGTLAPAFAPQITAYSLSVPNATATLTVTPTAALAGASILVNGNAVASGTTSPPIALGTGPTVITVLVTAQDTAVKKSYSLTVTRGPSPNADLSALATSVGTLAPAFAPATTAYTVSVPHATTSLTVTPTSAHSGATLQVNGNAVVSGTASGPVALAVGPTVITVRVTAQDTAVRKSYTLTVNRAASPNADLSALTVSVGTLAPAFAAATTSYSVSVTVASIRVTPTAAAAGATIQVNSAVLASGAASAPIDLAVGPNAVTVRVTAPDGTTFKTYTVNVTRVSTDPSLSALAFPAGGSINPAFTPAGTAYTITATAAMNAFTVRPTAAAAGATLTVDGTAVASGATSGNLDFPIGSSSHTVVVTAPDRVTTRTYNLTVNRPVPRSMRFGYATLDSYASSHALTANVHNPAGGAVDFVWTGKGNYTFHFRGLAAFGGAPGIVHATAHTPGTLGAACKVLDWSGTEDLTVRINCYDMGGGFTDSRVSILVLFPRNGTDGHNAAFLADQPSRTPNSPYEPAADHAHNSGGGITVTRRQDGDYFVMLEGMGGMNGGTPMVTAVGTGNARCHVDDFNGNGPDMSVYVTCKLPNGTAADAQFTLSTMQPYAGTADGLAVARVDAGELSGYTFNNGGGAVTVAAGASAGIWNVTFAGLASRGSTRPGNVQASIRSTGQETCQVGAWAVQGNNLTATVKCFDGLGNLQDWTSSFLIWVMK